MPSVLLSLFLVCHVIFHGIALLFDFVNAIYSLAISKMPSTMRRHCMRFQMRISGRKFAYIWHHQNMKKVLNRRITRIRGKKRWLTTSNGFSGSLFFLLQYKYISEEGWNDKFLWAWKLNCRSNRGCTPYRDKIDEEFEFNSKVHPVFDTTTKK